MIGEEREAMGRNYCQQCTQPLSNYFHYIYALAKITRIVRMCLNLDKKEKEREREKK